MGLAEEHVARGNHEAARLLYAQIVTGMYEFDPSMLIARARALFAELVRTQDQWRQSLLPEDREWFDLARRKVG